jgi:hypothetical protein
MAILRDNKGNMFRIETCKYCTDYEGRPKPILPEDMWGAKKMPDGSYKCLTCQTEELQTKILKVTPIRQPAQEIIVERQLKEHKELQLKVFEDKIRKMAGTGKWY